MARKRPDVDALTRQALSILGRMGGKAGTGKAKKRGNAEHYRTIAKKRWDKVRATRAQESHAPEKEPEESAT